MINDVEDIFREMQADCEKTFEEKEKEVDMNVVRGSRDFISGLIAKGFSQNSKYKPGDQMDLFDNEEFTKGIGNA